MLDDLLLSRAVVDRAAHHRVDAAWQERRLADPGTVVMHVGSNGAAVVGYPRSDPRLLLTPAAGFDMETAGALSFLGLDDDDRAYFAAHAHDSTELPAEAQWHSLREIGHRLTDVEAGLTVTAVALHQWRARTRACSACGGPLTVSQAGWAMHCADDGIDVFPRTDPAVIVLVRDREDRAMLGRQESWEQGRFSTFAGFVEAGESAEAAVRREVEEETGIRISPDPDDLVYLGSQPWPFPCSLMLGYHAWTDHTEIRVDADEIAEAYWFSRDELRRAVARGEVRLPPSVSVSRRLIERWFGGPISGGSPF